MYAVRLYNIQDFGHKKNLPFGTIHTLRKHWRGWVNSEICHFCLLKYKDSGWVGQKILPKMLTEYLNGTISIKA